MTAWTSEELDKIGNAEELKIAPLQSDGALQKPVIIWVVRIGEELYVRSYKGRGSGWFKGVLARHEGHIRAGGVDRDVIFVEVSDPAVQEQINAAYRTKYHRYAVDIVESVITPVARAATIKLSPR